MTAILNGALQFISLVPLIAIAYIGYWRDDTSIYLITGLGWTIFGLFYIATSQYMGIIYFLFGLYTFKRAWVLRKQSKGK
jgi:hypothetical protein